MADPNERLLAALARREHSAAELARKLSQWYPDWERDERDALITDLQGLGLQSDARFAEALIRSRLGRGHGRARIEAELATHGIAKETARHLWPDVADDDASRAVAVLEKWARSKTAPTRDQALRFLAHRGFDFSDANTAVQTIFG